jgi:hypothetical protein
MAQVVKMCERWGRWYAGFEPEDEPVVSLGDLPKSVSDRLASVSTAVARYLQPLRILRPTCLDRMVRPAGKSNTANEKNRLTLPQASRLYRS